MGLRLLQQCVSFLQQENSTLQQENLTLQQQFSPLQQQVAKLQEELSYKEKRIQELKEPKSVMPSTLSQQGPTSQSVSFGDTTLTDTGLGTAPTSTTEVGTGRRICPNCGAFGFAIKEIEDKSKIVSYIPKPIYAKKMHCTKCGYEF